MAAIGGFRSDLSITRKTDGNFGNVPKSRIKENDGSSSRLPGIGFCTLCQHFFENFSEAKALSIIRAF